MINPLMLTFIVMANMVILFVMLVALAGVNRSVAKIMRGIFNREAVAVFLLMLALVYSVGEIFKSPFSLWWQMAAFILIGHMALRVMWTHRLQ